MRVIAGSARGRRLKSPPEHLPTRPTVDRVKEGIFDILAPDLPGTVFLDLFAGSGSVGIEALSQGAAEAWFVENNPACLKVIEANLALTGLRGQAKIFRGDVRRAIRHFLKNMIKFDIMFFDPPYLQEFYDEFLGPEKRRQLLDLLKKGGQLLIEYGTRIDLPASLGPVDGLPAYTWGENSLVILRKTDK